MQASATTEHDNKRVIPETAMMQQETERLRQRMRKIVRESDRRLGHAADRGVEGAANVVERFGHACAMPSMMRSCSPNRCWTATRSSAAAC